MNIAGTIYPAYNGYDGMAYEIYISGCHQKCPGCHNHHMQNFNLGKEADVDEIAKDIKSRGPFVDYISFLGGEPLDQEGYEFMTFMVSLKARFPTLQFMLFTGHVFSDIPLWCFDMFDRIKYGPYLDTLKQEGFPASSNQAVWKKGDTIWAN